MLTIVVSKVLGGSAERVEGGSSSSPVQETASSVYHVVSGSGHSVVDGQTIDWVEGDTFCVPAWNKYQHFADSSQPVYLYSFHDRPMLTSLGFYRRADVDVESYASG